jgi:hypothetical protein
VDAVVIQKKKYVTQLGWQNSGQSVTEEEKGACTEPQLMK